MGIDCYDHIGAADARTAGTAHLLGVSHHLLSSFLHLCEGKIDPGVTGLALVTLMTL